MSRQPDPVMTLNNILQRQGRTNALLWKETSAGPAHDPTWTVTAFIDRVEYGYGICTRKMDARQEAARKALEALMLVEMTDRL
ncbi:hypothetical protein RSOLAG1IB_06593 [Rhizoctonia solani AG-1 IB]|uniref:DRBM domain-containing protein n=1 Tax=Thanatephorus cucumeris (strain AG1-IB / isolate 7/3/14) TaxID=1108050 RepID=A0A0B7FC47_THACB|nr:hypothetical protein RSOLAG1IB_06593 [Rhizoctonia solani AG-1 IB]